MRNAKKWLRVMAPAMALWLLAVAGWSQDEEQTQFKPNLGQAREQIGGMSGALAQIPVNAPEVTAYPVPAEQPRPLLTEVPGKPFKQVTPIPRARAWWKYPLYVAVGLPRDLIDAGFGAMSNVPFFNIPFVYLPYEVVPTQILIRDPRDWHRWPGRRNSRGHGMIDPISWGWFPSAHSWHFTYPSARLARKYQAENEALQKELDAMNQRIEEQNRAVTARGQEALTKAREAITAGNGREAAMRMLAYNKAYPLDESAFALYVTSLAMFAPEGPAWVKPALIDALNTAQPRALEQAERLLTQTVKSQSYRPSILETLIYTQLILGKEESALANARELLKVKPDDPERQRLVFESAMAAGNAPLAEKTLAGLTQLNAETRQMMELRLRLLKGEVEPARQTLAEMQARQPEDPYLNYYLGSALMLEAQQAANPAEGMNQALPLVEKAALGAPNPALAQRAGAALSYINGVLRQVRENPELFAPQPTQK